MARDLVLEVIEQVRGNALGEAARDLDKVADRTDRAADSARDYSGDLKDLDTQIASTRVKIQALGSEFVATRDKATTGKDLRSERGLLGQLERIRKELADAAPDLAPAGAAIGGALGAKAGKGFIGSFFDVLGELPSKLKGSMLVAVLAGAAAAAPAVAGSIAGAVVGGVGLGGIAGGIGAASKDPRVRTAAADFGESISAEFFSGGQAFVQPTIDSLAILQAAFADMDLGDSWQRVAPFVTSIAEGIGGLGREFMPGFNRALDASGPALVLLGQELPKIGRELGNMIGDIAESEGALEGLLFVLDLIQSTIRATGAIITWFSDRFDDLVTVGIEMTGVMEDLPFFKLQELAGIDMSDLNDKLELLRARTQGAGQGLNTLTDAGHANARSMYTSAEAAALMAEAVQRLADEYSDFLGIQMSVDQANQRYAESLLRLKEALSGGVKDWRDNTEAGLENRSMLSAAVAELIRVRQGNIDSGMAAADATAKFQAELDALSKLATNAGISKEALQDLVGDYYVRVNISTTGEDAYRAAIGRALANSNRISGFQHGGDPPLGEPFWVGEGGRPELMVLSPRPHVFSNQESTAMAAGGAGASARQTALLETVVDMLKKLEQRQPTVINVNAPEGTSPRELTAIVSREMAWTR